MTQERVLEMYRKFMSLGTIQGEEQEVLPGSVVTNVATMKLTGPTIPESLLSLGIAKTEDEAIDFIISVIGGTLMAVAVGKEDGLEGMNNLLKIGFQIGLLAGQEKKGREVN